MTPGSRGITSRRTRANLIASAPEFAADERFGAGGEIALVEDQIDGREDRGEPLAEPFRWRHLVRNPGVADLSLRPNQPLSPSADSASGSPRSSRPVYLIFNEGYLASGAESLVRGRLCAEARMTQVPA